MNFNPNKHEFNKFYKKFKKGNMYGRKVKIRA